MSDTETTDFTAADYPFYGREPTDWHEDLRWYVWFSTPPSEWTDEQVELIARALRVGVSAPAFGAPATVQLDGDLVRLAGALDDLDAGPSAFQLMNDVLDRVHAIAPIRQVLVGGVTAISERERAHVNATGSLPDLGDGPVAIDDWEVESVALDDRPLQPSPRLALALERAQQDVEAAARAAALAAGALVFVPSDSTPPRGEPFPGELAATRPGEALQFPAGSPSRRRWLATRTRPTAGVVEFTLDAASAVVIHPAHAVVSPNQRPRRAAYLDSDDWVVVLSSNNSPGATSALELWRRTAHGFVRTDDAPCDAIELATAGRFIVVATNQRAAVFARVGESLVELGHASIAANVQLAAGPEEQLYCLARGQTRWSELANHHRQLAAQPEAAAADPAPERLVSIDMNARLVAPPKDAPPNARETQSSAGWYWARTPASIEVWTPDGRRSFTPPAAVAFPLMSLHPTGSRAWFGLEGDQVAELDAVAGTWTVLSTELGRPFYLHVGDVELLGLSTATAVNVYRRAGDALGELVTTLELGVGKGRYDVCATECGRASLVGRDQHLYTLVADAGGPRFERGPVLRAPGRRLHGKTVQGRVEDGVGYFFVETARGLGEYCLPSSLTPLT